MILLITDGGLTDFIQTKQVLVRLSSLPVSVVLVGVGHGDMTSLVQLDSDRARLCSGDTQAARDIVQFVGMIDNFKFTNIQTDSDCMSYKNVI